MNQPSTTSHSAWRPPSWAHRIAAFIGSPETVCVAASLSIAAPDAKTPTLIAPGRAHSLHFECTGDDGAAGIEPDQLGLAAIRRDGLRSVSTAMPEPHMVLFNGQRIYQRPALTQPDRS